MYSVHSLEKATSQYLSGGISGPLLHHTVGAGEALQIERRNERREVTEGLSEFEYGIFRASHWSSPEDSVGRNEIDVH